MGESLRFRHESKTICFLWISIKTPKGVFIETQGGIEPPYKSFADSCLTTWRLDLKFYLLLSIVSQLHLTVCADSCLSATRFARATWRLDQSGINNYHTPGHTLLLRNSPKLLIPNEKYLLLDIYYLLIYSISL